jgi:integrase
VHLAKTGRNRKHVLLGKADILERFILPFMGDMRVDDVERAHLVAWMESLSELRTDQGKPYAKATLAGAWRTIRTLFRDALVLCDLERDPTMGVRFHVKGPGPKPKDVLTQAELLRLLEGAEHEKPDVRAVLWVGFTTGMRFGELSALTWEDVDFARGFIHVRRSQVNGNVGPTKTETARTVPLHPTVAVLLREHEERQLELLVRSKLVFPARTGGYRYPSSLRKPLARCAQRGAVDKHVTAHTMRRTFNNLARQAAGEIVTRAMTGHATAAMTEHYSDVTLDEKMTALTSAMGPLLGPPAGTKPKAGQTPAIEHQRIPAQTPGDTRARPEPSLGVRPRNEAEGDFRRPPRNT